MVVFTQTLQLEQNDKSVNHTIDWLLTPEFMWFF